MNQVDALYLASAPLTIPYFLFRYFVRGKYHESLPAMWGYRLPAPGWRSKLPARQSSNEPAPLIWLHAVSVGEVVAATSIIDEMNRWAPHARFIVSTVTETGQAAARRAFADNKAVVEVIYYPLDLSWIVRRFLDVYRPDALIIMETELWPNMLTLAGRRGIALFMLNGRLSDRSYPWYARFRWLFREPLSRLRACAVQSEEDARRLRSLCPERTQIIVTGNCKFDSPAARLGEDDRRALREQYLLSEDRSIVVAGSTHPGEEDLVLGAWRQAMRRFERATLIIAPRHPERFEEVARAIARHNLTFSRSSRPDKRDPQVLLIDEMGVLARAYGLCMIAIVCGSFVPIGGHNLLEAAVHGVPVVFGPYMHKQREMLRIFGPESGGLQVPPEQLGQTLTRLMDDPQTRLRHGQAARRAVDANRGSARRSCELILPFLRAESN